ncbi:MAG TPA: hypothetical protein VJN41_05710, partial [Alphaproteobacteria bacterium]|nr:hypothetical protein [Alphaproteobacteria bacterium]
EVLGRDRVPGPLEWTMALTRRAIDMLIDLAENKLTSICSFDRDDAREIKELESCIRELSSMRDALASRRLTRKIGEFPSAASS